MSDWQVRDYNPDTDEAPEGSEHDCTGEPEDAGEPQDSMMQKWKETGEDAAQ